jgi:hypothetical protein
VNAPFSVNGRPNIHAVEAQINFACSVAVVVTLSLIKDIAGNALAAAQLKVPAINTQCQIGLKWSGVANASSAVYSAHIGPASAGTITLNGVSGARKMGGVMVSSIHVTEISA